MFSNWVCCDAKGCPAKVQIHPSLIRQLPTGWTQREIKSTYYTTDRDATISESVGHYCPDHKP